MKRLYWLLQAIFNPVENDILNSYGCWTCYLLSHGVGKAHDHVVIEMDGYKMGKVLEKLDKHLQNI